MTEAVIPAALDMLAATPATMRSLLVGLPDEMTSAAGPEGWSARDVVAHVLSVNGPALVDRVRLIVERDAPPLPNVDEQATLERSGLRSRQLKTLLDEFARQRGGAVMWLRNLQAESLVRTGEHSVAGVVSAADIIVHVAWHDLLHVEQVCRLLAPAFDEHRGAMRRFR
ncbi:MAG TPA: DinB family protein [Dehalococcoidia bacterium]|nr:DinB family protein [Dehalococcoidia bacterium]